MIIRKIRMIKMNEEEIECYKNKEGKLKILLDENRLDEKLIKALKKIFNVKKAIKNKGLDDNNVMYQQAMKDSRVILTNDRDFWKDDKFPMNETKGIIIIAIKDTDEAIIALKKFFDKFGEITGFGRSCNEGYWIRTKVNVQKTGFAWRYITLTPLT